ncbi:hypothetical protein H6786_00340 [Candidatus Nomurabacteria bacterium]|nr:hypothetical protein [Candidatus Nomurabacteria bacterium]
MKFGRLWKLHKAIWVVITAMFVSVLFLSLFQMPMGMDMTTGASGCPFMSHGEEVLCSMNTLEHLSAWQSAFTAIVPTFGLLTLTVVSILLLASVAPNLLSTPRFSEPSSPRYLREQIYTFSYRPLQELFSSGILHPKLF